MPEQTHQTDSDHVKVPDQAHRGGLAHAVGSGASIVTAGVYGSVVFWPEAELRSVAEAVGFVLPLRRPAQQGEGRRVSISQVRAYTHSLMRSFEGLFLRVPRTVVNHQSQNTGERVDFPSDRIEW